MPPVRKNGDGAAVAVFAEEMTGVFSAVLKDRKTRRGKPLHEFHANAYRQGVH
jgi:hypothetical protein